jgi:hypothetical protein
MCLKQGRSLRYTQARRSAILRLLLPTNQAMTSIDGGVEQPVGQVHRQHFCSRWQ